MSASSVFENGTASTSLTIKNVQLSSDGFAIQIVPTSGESSSYPSVNLQVFQGCSVFLSNNVEVRSVSSHFMDTGRFVCANNGSLYYSNGTARTSASTRCLSSSLWEGEQDLQCWLAPSPVVIDQSENQSGTIQKAIRCEYDDVIPRGFFSTYYISNEDPVTLNKEDWYKLSPRDDGQEVFCQAVTEITQDSDLGFSPPIRLNITHSPLLWKSMCVGILGRTHKINNCIIKLSSNPRSQFVSLTMNGKNVTNLGKNRLVNSVASNNQTFTYKRRFTEADNGTYILTVRYPPDASLYNLYFDYLIGCPVVLPQPKVKQKVKVGIKNGRVYGRKGMFTCPKGTTLFYSNGTRPSKRRTVCQVTSKWTGQDNLECWTAPNVILSPVMSDTSGAAQVSILCEYNDTFPVGDKSIYYFGEGSKELPKGEPLVLQSGNNDHYQNVSCQAVTPYTQFFNESGRSSASGIHIPHAPYQTERKPCSWFVGQSGSCIVNFLSNPPVMFESLTKHGSPVQNEMVSYINTSTQSIFNHQTFVLFRSMVKLIDNGTYSLNVRTPDSSQIYTMSFDQDLTTQLNQTDGVDYSPVVGTNSDVIIGVTTAVVVVFVVLLIVLTVLCRKMQHKVEEKEEEEESQAMAVYVEAGIEPKDALEMKEVA
ncbi:unnamed protein product [Clavelina lepadiformis]|uniref:Uncharacterized protein n=1 Tax=Clavelina lepadiformis TaxID=159417 RepID=A0ABP0FEB9_CLALP